ncbi:MAG: hypothetical protein M3N98_06510, partial [Actinomycetota bacterium]|nr:hypothetical protein [Actinomycetota bacterium]
MPDIRYVCLSDLHFGAENSLLSRLVDGDVVVDPTTASPVLDGLVAGLTALIGANQDRAVKPTLILNGDILELALASDNVAMMVFELFLERIFPADREALFDSTVIYQPGNHDHHLWETARERQYGNLLRTLPPDVALPIPWHTTRLDYLRETRPVQSELLDNLARRRHSRHDVKFRMSYPNLGLLSEDGETAVVFHHGHYLEPIYQLMTSMKDVIFPGRPSPGDVLDIEAENFAWIDFFWSTLGRSGQVGQDVGVLYDMLQSPAAIDRLTGNLATGITSRMAGKGVAKRFGWLLRPLLRAGLKRAAVRLAASERTLPTAPLSPKAEAGLMDYMSGPLINQLRRESRAPDGRLPRQVKLVFGHTHKPFLSSRDVPGLAEPVRIFNTGGWVVDTHKVEPCHGANVVLVDAALEVVCLRMYNQGSYQVRLDDSLPVEQGPFYRRVSSLIDAAEEPWAGFSAAVALQVAERERALDTIIANAWT